MSTESLPSPALLATKSLRDDPFRYGVVPMALFVAVLIIVSGYFADHVGGSDELGLYNPTYMDVHYGKATYPIYNFYDSMPVHPPIHYKGIALFMRAGLTLYYAQATPTVLMSLLCVWLIVRSAFSSPIQIALLFGLCLTYAFFFKTGMELFGMRPEGELAAAWLAGLLVFETARQDDWNLPKLFAGSLLLTYASSLHYYGTVAVLGAVVYAAVAWWELGWGRARSVILAIAAGGLLYGGAELILWVIPERSDILYMLRGTDTHGGIAAAIREHVAQYRYWAAQEIGPAWMRPPFTVGLPAVLISTPLFLALRQTRVLALAALPMQVFLLLFAWHKHAYYFIHEIGLYGAAVVAVVLTLLGAGLRKIPASLVRQAIALAAVGYLAFSLWDLTRYRGGILWTLKPRVHEAEVARAAAREILGPNAKVASRITSWYASGAADLYDFSYTILVRPRLTPEEADQYLSKFDAVAEAGHMSNDTHNLDHKALLSWYVDGVLHLRGFYFADADSSLSYLLLQTNVTTPVKGFGLKAGKLHSFVENPSGDEEFVALAGPYAAMNAILPAATFSHIMLLPRTESRKDEVLLTAIIPPAGPRNYSQLLPDCRILQKVPMSDAILSPDDLVRKLRREDRPIRFHQANIPGPNDSLGGAKDLPRLP